MKDFIIWSCLDAAKLMSSVRLWRDERGGIHLVLFALLGMIFAAVLWAVTWNWMLQTVQTNKTKPLIDHATHASSLNLDRDQAALGRLVWDEIAGREDFYRYLRLNLKLAEDLSPLPGSPLTSKPIVHRLEFVTAGVYPFTLSRSLHLYGGTEQETTRNIQVTLYGPSVVAIIEMSRALIGSNRREEPIVLSSVAGMRFRP